MDNLSGCFERLSGPSSSKQHPRFSQYKGNLKKISQEERRKITLESQKQKRFDYQNFIRKLTVDDDTTPDNAESKIVYDEMDWHEDAPIKMKPARLYSGQLMLSEWLLKDQIPSNFEADWILVGCPVGKRCLVVASKGRTRVYTKNGYKIIEFDSLLPGGGFQTQKNSDSTILDCVWVEKNQSYYVLDIICWGKVILLNCESQFRFYWINSKWKDEPELTLKSKKNRYPFLSLLSTPCKSQANMEQFIVDTLSETWSLDGLLFYHKNGHYTPGSCPLVLWLKPFMLPDILNVVVPEVYMQTNPENCANLMDITGV